MGISTAKPVVQQHLHVGPEVGAGLCRRPSMHPHHRGPSTAGRPPVRGGVEGGNDEAVEALHSTSPGAMKPPGSMPASAIGSGRQAGRALPVAASHSQMPPAPVGPLRLKASVAPSGAQARSAITPSGSPPISGPLPAGGPTRSREPPRSFSTVASNAPSGDIEYASTSRPAAA